MVEKLSGSPVQSFLFVVCEYGQRIFAKNFKYSPPRSLNVSLKIILQSGQLVDQCF